MRKRKVSGQERKASLYLEELIKSIRSMMWQGTKLSGHRILILFTIILRHYMANLTQLKDNKTCLKCNHK
jgi:hypothetical protein